MKKKKAVSVSKIGIPKSYSLLEDGLSQSLLKSYLSCPKDFALSLNKYTSAKLESMTSFGAMFHECLDKIYSVGKIPSINQINQYIDDYMEKEADKIKLVPAEQIEQDAALTEATLICYVEYYKKDFVKNKYFDVEEVFDVKFKAWKMRGKIDGKFIAKDGKKWLMEHKTKGQINLDNILKLLTFDIQNQYYLLADYIKSKKLAQGVLYNIIRKSGSKIKKNENVFEYKNRMIENISKDPGYYFMRIPVKYSKKSMDIFTTELQNHFMDIEQLVLGGVDIIPNKNSCAQGMFTCKFLDACTSNSMIGYIKRKELFTELKKEN